MSLRSKYLYGILILTVVITVVGVNFFLGYNEIADHFTFTTVALAETTQRNAQIQIAPYPPVTDGWQNHANSLSLRFVPTIFLLLLNHLTGIPLQSLALYPLLGLVFAFLAFVFASNLAGSRIVGLIFALAVTLDPLTVLTRNIYYISVGLMLFWLFLIFWIKWIKNPDSKKYPILIFVTFILAFFSYYTAEFLIIIVMFAFSILSVVLRRFGKNLDKPKGHMYLTLAFLAIFVVFDPVFSNTFSSLSLSRAVSTIQRYLNYLFAFFGAGPASAVSEYRPNYSNLLPLYTQLLQYVIIGFCIFVYIFLSFRQIRKEKKITLKSEHIIFLSLFFAGAVETFVYLTMGFGFNLKSLLWFLLLATLYSLYRFYKRIEGHPKKWRHRGIVLRSLIIFIVSMMIFVGITKTIIPVFDGSSLEEPHFFSNMQATSIWISQNMNSGKIITDGRFAAELFAQLVAVGKQNSLISTRFSTNDINYLRGNYSIESPSIIVLPSSMSTRSFSGGDIWAINFPLGNATEGLNQLTNLNKVYDDGFGLIYVASY
jgi:hypothetical protein